MKSYIKTSFFLVLLVAVFNIGVSDAYAEEIKASETNKIETRDAVALQCSMQIITSLTTTLESKVLTGFYLLGNTETGPGCTYEIIELRNAYVVIFSDCTVRYYPKEPME